MFPGKADMVTPETASVSSYLPTERLSAIPLDLPSLSIFLMLEEIKQYFSPKTKNIRESSLDLTFPSSSDTWFFTEHSSHVSIFILAAPSQEGSFPRYPPGSLSSSHP